MEAAPTVRFAEVARRLGAAARAAGLVVPVFRTPPRAPAADRTIRQLPGGPVVAVRVRSRPFADVVNDMIDGVVVANRLRGAGATRVRATLRAAVEPSAVERPVGRTRRDVPAYGDGRTARVA